MTTPKESGWRERFDQLLLAHIAIQSGWLAGVNTGNEFHEAGNRIKDLIAQVEATAIAATEARVVEKLDGMKKECIHKRNWDGKTQLQPCACVFKEVGGYNQALEDVRALFSSKT